MGSPGSRTSQGTRSPSDDEIILRIIAGDVNLFEELLDRYRGYVFRIVRGHLPSGEVENIAHDVFLRTYQSLSSFKEGKKFSSWIAGIATRTCYDYWRKRYKSREVPISHFSEDAQKWLENATRNQSYQAFRNKLSGEEARELLSWALGQLSAEERIILELTYLEGRSIRETAERLGWSIANVKIRAFRARQKLRKRLTRLIKNRRNIK
jgi:RNA polymerase sigma-70 factor (ECF subfamily)